MASIRMMNNKKGISYKIEVSNGYDLNGKKIRQTTTFVPDPGMTKKQQEKALQKFVMEFEDRVKNGKRISGDKTTLKEFTEEWFQVYAENQLEKTTRQRYRYVLDVMILPALGHLKIGRIKPYDIECFFVSLTKEGARHDGKAGGYSHESIRKAKTILSSIFSTAEQWELVENNPCKKANMPKHCGSGAAIKAYTLDQTRRFLQFVEDDYRNSGGNLFKLQMLVMINIAVFGGLRRGEMVGLDWNHINYEKNVIYVRQSAARVGGEAFIKTPKSRCSIRTIVFPKPVMELLKELQQAQDAYKNNMKDQWAGTEDCVFIQKNGSRLNITTPYHKYHSLLKQYNKTVGEEMRLPILSLHSLRHTNASLLIHSNHVDIVSVSKKLGHADPNITAKYYLHSYDEGEQETADVLESMILGNR